MLERLRSKFSTKLILLISLVFLIPVLTTLVTLLVTSRVSLDRFDAAIARGGVEESTLLREILPHGKPEKIADADSLLTYLRSYEERRSVGLFVSLLVVSFVLAAVVVLLSMLILKRGMLSLHELSMAAAKVGEGDFNVHPVCRSHDEFADLVGAFTTMTGRLRETMISRDFYNHVLESMPAAVFTLDADRVITTWNRQAAVLTGLDPAETVGRRFDEFLDWLGPAAAMEDIPAYGREAVIRTRDGEQRIVSKGVDFLYDRAGNHSGIIETFIDISEQKALEHQLVIAKERAEESSRLRSEFLANMSHEIRTPLNGILGLAELSVEGEEDSEKRQTFQTIHQCGKNLLHLINEILELSKLEAGKMVLHNAIVSLEDVVREAVSTMRSNAEQKGLTLTVAIAESAPPTLEVDARKLVQILLNLLGNALKFTEEGEIRLEVRRNDQQHRGDLLFVVSDTGCGIPEDRREHIFESFVQAEGYLKRGGEGTGLGLTIVRKLVALMGGELWLESEVGKGSTFSFTIESGVTLQDLDRR